MYVCNVLSCAQVHRKKGGFLKRITKLFIRKTLQRAGRAFRIIPTEPRIVRVSLKSIKHKCMTLFAYWFSIRRAMVGNDCIFLNFRHDRHIVLHKCRLLILSIEVAQVSHQIVNLQSFNVLIISTSGSITLTSAVLLGSIIENKTMGLLGIGQTMECLQ